MDYNYINAGGVVTPDNIVKLTQGASPVQIVLLILFGCLFFWCIIWSVNWLINLKMGELPKDIKEIKQKHDELKNGLISIENRMWSKDDFRDTVNLCILEHAKECPARKCAK
jgi:hypothetical protein